VTTIDAIQTGRFMADPRVRRRPGVDDHHSRWRTWPAGWRYSVLT